MSMRPIKKSDGDIIGNFLRVSICAVKPELTDRVAECDNDEMSVAIVDYIKATSHTAKCLVRICETRKKCRDDLR